MPLYVTQEKAFAPGIVKDWPDVINHPEDSNGRLTKLIKEELSNYLNLLINEFEDKYYHCDINDEDLKRLLADFLTEKLSS